MYIVGSQASIVIHNGRLEFVSLVFNVILYLNLLLLDYNSEFLRVVVYADFIEKKHKNFCYFVYISLRVCTFIVIIL